MIYNKETSEKSQVKYIIDVATEDWAKAIEEAYNKTKFKYSIEGFRKGKAPKRVIERMYGAGVFFEDALDIVIPQSYEELLAKETELMPVARPDFDIVAISDTDLKLSCVVTVKPEVKLGAYTGLTIKKVEKPITDEDVANELKKAQDKAATFENVVDRAAALGDSTIIDFSGSVDGVKFEGGSAEKQELNLGSGTFIPGFEEQVVGMTIGESKDVKVTFPKEYGAEELAGKDAVFAVVLHEIKVKKLPALDDEFAKDASEFDTLDAYKADIRKGLETVNNDKAKQETETAVLDAIADKTEVEIPDAMIVDQVNNMIQEFEYRLMYQGMKAEDYYKYTGSSRDELATQYRTSAERSVKIRLVMEALIKAENIKVDDSEIDEKIATFAKNANKNIEEYKKDMRDEQKSYIVNDLLMDKTFEFLYKNNKLV